MASGSDPSLERIRIRCPDCGGTFRIRPTMIGRSGPCARCGSSFTATRELVVSGARDRSGGPVGSRAADHGQQGPGRRNRGYRPALPEAVPLQLLLRPPVAVVFVPGCFLIGLFLWINAWTESEHFESSGRAVMYLWWILYPAIGYYLSIGWVAAGMGTSRQARFLGTNVLLVVSDAFVAMSSFFMILFASMFRVSRKGIRDLCKLWGMLNAAIIRGASRAVGRLVSATLLPAPLVAWALCTRNRPLGTPGNFALHVAGLLPGMIVLGLFLAPLSEQARYQQKSAQVQAAGAIPGQPSHPQAASKVAGPESDLTAGDPSQGIWTGNWQLSYDKAKLTLEQRGSSATGAVQVSFGGPIEGTARGDALSGVWHRRYGVGATPFEFHMERDGRSFKGWFRHNARNTTEVWGTRTSPCKLVEEAQGRVEFATWSAGPMFSLAEAGYRSGAAVMLGETLNMDAAERALRDRFTLVGRSGNSLRVEKVGPAEASLWLREDDALLVLAAAASLEKRETLVALEVAWQDVLKCLASSGALSRPVQPVLRWENATEFFTEKPNQYQRISVLSGFRDGALSCPPAQPAWTQAMPRRKTYDGGAFWLTLSQGDKSLINLRNAYFMPLTSFTDLPFGDHALAAHVRDDALLVFDGFYPAADGRLSLAPGKGSAQLVQRAKYSLPTTECRVPNLPSSPSSRLAKTGEASAAELSFCFAMEVPVTESLKLEPIRRAMEGKGWTLQSAGGALRTAHPDHPGQIVFVLSDGRITACRQGESPGWEDVQDLEKTWLEAARCVASVSAAVPESNLRNLVLTKARFYSAKPLQYQRLYVLMNTNSSLSNSGLSTLGWALDLPRGSLKWSVGTWGGHYHNDVFKVGDTAFQRPAKDSRELTWVTAPITSLTPGPQPVQISCKMNRPDYQVCIEMMFENPEGEAILYDNCRKSVATRVEYSRPLGCLLLPCSDREKPGKDASRDSTGDLAGVLRGERFTSELHLSWQADFRQGKIVAVRQQLRDESTLPGPLRILSSRLAENQVSYRWVCGGRRGEDVITRLPDGRILFRTSATPAQTAYLTRLADKSPSATQ